MKTEITASDQTNEPKNEFLPPDEGEIDYADWPAPLRKAVHDHWRYLVGLTDGSIIHFGRAEIDRNWITLHDIEFATVINRVSAEAKGIAFFWGRGLCVHKKQIVWCADCDS